MYHVPFSSMSDINSKNTNCLFKQCRRKPSLTALGVGEAARLGVRTGIDHGGRQPQLKFGRGPSPLHLAKPPHTEMGKNSGRSREPWTGTRGLASW